MARSRRGRVGSVRSYGGGNVFAGNRRTAQGRVSRKPKSTKRSWF